MTHLTEEDIAYVRRWFVPRAEACAGRALDLARLPGPAYELDGVAYVAPDWLALVDEAGSLDALPGQFAERYARAAASLPRAQSLDEAWHGYLGGLFAVCLRVVTPETIARKEHLVAVIDAAIAQPRPDDAAWRRELRLAVLGLDALERDFTAYDRVRFGAVTRDRCITAVRRAYPAVFA